MTLLYSFKSFKFHKELEEVFGSIFIVDKPKRDFERLKLRIEELKPDLIIGIAKARKSSTIEKIAINKFNRTGKISLNGKQQYELFAPNSLSQHIKIHNSAWTSFCNWFAYKVAEFVEKNQFEIETTFIHLHERDLEEAIKSLEKIKS